MTEPTLPPETTPPIKAPTKRAKSAFRRKMLTRSGETLELGGRALLGVGLIKGLLGDSIGGAPPRLTPLIAVIAIVGGVLILAGVYLQAEAER